MKPGSCASALVLVVMLLAAAQPAAAQSRADKPLDEKQWIEPPANPPKSQRGDRTHDIDFLFGALKAAPDETSAKSIEDRIWALWLASGSDTCNLLMSRVKTALDKQEYDLAIRLLDAIIEIRPQYVEAWNRRATVFYLKKDYASALADLRHVLAREPRHFGALAGLGMIFQDIGDDKHALEAFRRVLEVHPHLKGMEEKVKTLTEKVEGRSI